MSVGDHLLYDARSGYVVEKLPKSEAEELVLEEVPDVDYEHIGGLAKEIEQVRDAVELPFLYPATVCRAQIEPPERRAAVWPSRLRQDLDRESRREFDREEARTFGRERTAELLSCTSKVRSC